MAFQIPFWYLCLPIILHNATKSEHRPNFTNYPFQYCNIPRTTWPKCFLHIPVPAKTPRVMSATPSISSIILSPSPDTPYTILTPSPLISSPMPPSPLPPFPRAPSLHSSISSSHSLIYPSVFPIPPSPSSTMPSLSTDRPSGLSSPDVAIVMERDSGKYIHIPAI